MRALASGSCAVARSERSSRKATLTLLQVTGPLATETPLLEGHVLQRTETPLLEGYVVSRRERADWEGCGLSRRETLRWKGHGLSPRGTLLLAGNSIGGAALGCRQAAT